MQLVFGRGLCVPLAAPILTTSLDGRPPDRRGKVRDLYDFGDLLLVVATDRVSAFDYVLGTGIPDKGRILTQLSTFWFDRTRSIVANHVVTTNPADYPHRGNRALLAGRSMLVRKTDPLPIECVARGYLSGSGWKDYLATGDVCGHRLPPGLNEAARLPEPIFTPATKAQDGHDINISEAEAVSLVGPAVFERVRELTLRLYAEGARHAESRGIIVADTKFEFGLLPRTGDSDEVEGRLIVIDEMLTPDSSRFWPGDSYRPGGPQLSFDKQFVRDYLERIRWNKQPPVPSLPEEVVAKTRDKYLEAFQRLTGRDLQ